MNEAGGRGKEGRFFFFSFYLFVNKKIKSYTPNL